MSRKSKSTPALRPGPATTGTVARSLHTPTALAALALYLHGNGSRMEPEALILEAAEILRVPSAKALRLSDPTLQAALKTLGRMIAHDCA